MSHKIVKVAENSTKHEKDVLMVTSNVSTTSVARVKCSAHCRPERYMLSLERSVLAINATNICLETDFGASPLDCLLRCF